MISIALLKLEQTSPILTQLTVREETIKEGAAKEEAIKDQIVKETKE